ncbi:MAG: GEVED domain-containing protein [Ferruginibacter sp.]
MRLFYQNGKTYLFSTLLFLMVCVTAMGQTTLSTTFANNNGFSLVTFNFTNNNATGVVITDIASVCGASGAQAVAAYYKASAINGAPGAISAANGWNQFGSANITGIANTTTTTPQPFMSGLSLVVPPGTTYGIAVQATSLRYSTLGGGTQTVSGGGCVITSGTNVGYAGDVAPNAPTFTPRGFIGSVTFIDAVPCSGTPNPGNTLSTANSVCPNINFTLSTQNPTPGTGVSYQWQKSADGTAWSDIAGATFPSYTTSQTVATYYRANVTCTGSTTASNALQVTMKPASQCYCIPPATNCTLDDEILNVTAAGINNSSSGCSGSGYTDYTNSVAAGSVAAGLNMPMSVSVGPGGTEYVGVWIDYNQNGAFDTNEFTLLGSANGATINGFVQIPVNATTGTTRMRVRVRFNTALTGANACSAYTYGETEDYLINITPCIPGTIGTQPANTSSYCSGNATISVAATGTGLTYQWQERVNASSPWTIISNGGIYSGASTPTLTLTNLTSNYNGHQFQVAIGGPCTPLFLSSVATLTVGPLVATVNPASATICNGSTQQLSITTTAPPATLSLTSGPITVAIPDNNVAGATSSITTNAIPAGALITGVKVKVNLGHTWPGDLCFALKGPNGNIVNLNYFLSGTGAGPGTGYVNTTWSSQTTPTLPLVGSASDPYTGTFRPDAVVTPVVGNPPAGPTGYTPNVNTLSALTTGAANGNGTWTLAIFDGFNGDNGTLTSWSLDITYGAPFAGIWTGTDIFNDAALTSPYVPGTLANTVYVHPSATTDYSVTISTPNCTSDPTIIPITVANPVGQLTDPSNTAVCVGGNTSFTVAAASGNPITYQWQVSTNAGATWTNISNTGVYSGATTNTLNLTAVPASYDNYLYRAVLSVAACTNTATSASAKLTVNPLPVVVINAGPYTSIHPGITTTVTAAVSPNAAATYQWYKDGVLIPGATAKSVTVDIDNLGDYSVAVTDVNGCSSNSGSLTISGGESDILFIYPSPNTGLFQVRYYNLNGNAINPRILNIFDSKGALVFSKTYSVTETYSKMAVDMSHYSSGIYRVELSDRNGKRIKTGSVVIL